MALTVLPPSSEVALDASTAAPAATAAPTTSDSPSETRGERRQRLKQMQDTVQQLAAEPQRIQLGLARHFYCCGVGVGGCGNATADGHVTRGGRAPARGFGGGSRVTCL
ncbi:hypothetical protein B0H14DRAFT_2568538 [Mycena olivaceomarginata]|nr:hypothetical protein B0H14DRAFT_2568538 [Mycena olivaceomarginata]